MWITKVGSKLGTVAVWVRSESGDAYLYCFENKHVEDIAKELTEDLEMFCPMCEWKTAGDNEDFVSDVDTFMYDLYDKSWERE